MPALRKARSLSPGATVTLMLSEMMSGALAVRTVEQARVALPPYVIEAVTSTKPAGIETGDVAVTQVGSAAVRVTEIPPAGAAIGDPPLCS